MPTDRDERRGTDHHGHDIIDPLYVGIVTVSTSRAQSDEKAPDDPGGDTVEECFEAEGHEVQERVLVRDDYAAIRTAVRRLVARRDIDVVITTGGTGVSADDVSPEATSALFERELPGFGELFRSLSWDEVARGRWPRARRPASPSTRPSSVCPAARTPAGPPARN